MSWWFGTKLWIRVIAGLILGVIFGLGVVEIMGEAEGTALLAKIKVVGDVFIRLIRMIIVPLIFTTLVAGMVAMGHPKKMGSIGLKAVLLYLATTLFANVIGLSMGTIFQPGVGVDLGGAERAELAGEAASIGERLMAIIPANPIQAFADGDVLAVIFFSLLLGVGIVMAGEPGKPLGRVFEAASEAVLNITHIIMELAPFGVFALIAYVAGTQGIATFTSVFKLAIAHYLGCLLHIVIIYGGLIRFVLNLPFIRFARGILDAQAVAYSTSSSSATLPVTISNVTDNLGVKKSVAGSVLPLGATINMDGTSLYLGVVALFTAQAFGYPLEMHHYFLIALTCSLASIGTAGIPSASLFLLAIVLDVFDVTPEHIALVVGFILPFDRLLDMMRTVVNVSGDAAVAVSVAKWEGELDEETYRKPAVE